MSAASGALCGMLIGLLVFVPGVGLLLGGAMGQYGGNLLKTSLSEEDEKELAAELAECN